jgi:aspartyl-tRNA(Asn)/glutamyl-tRNA(Gln) amidotransferase subunit B
MSALGLPYPAASVLSRDRALADFLEEAVRLGAAPVAAANWVVNDLQRELAAAGLGLAASKVTPALLAGLVALVEQGAVSTSQAKAVFSGMFATGETAAAVADRLGLRQSSDTGQLEAWCAAAIAADPKSADQVRAGNAKAINALKGAVMKLSAGRANPKLVDGILRKQLGV